MAEGIRPTGVGLNVTGRRGTGVLEIKVKQHAAGSGEHVIGRRGTGARDGHEGAKQTRAGFTRSK